jgi:hypothetical protein
VREVGENDVECECKKEYMREGGKKKSKIAH